MPSKTSNGLLTGDKQCWKYLIWWIRWDFVNFVLAVARTVNLYMVKWCCTARSTNHVFANMRVLQRNMSFSSTAQFHLERLSFFFAWVENMDQTDERCLHLSRSGDIWRIFSHLSYNRGELCPSVQYHLSLFSLSSGYHIRLSISTHPPLRRQALLLGFSDQRRYYS